jgi:hypothetical protein
MPIKPKGRCYGYDIAYIHVNGGRIQTVFGKPCGVKQTLGVLNIGGRKVFEWILGYGFVNPGYVFSGGFFFMPVTNLCVP